MANDSRSSSNKAQDPEGAKLLEQGEEALKAKDFEKVRNTVWRALSVIVIARFISTVSAWMFWCQENTYACACYKTIDH